VNELGVITVTIAYLARARECSGTVEEKLQLNQPASLQQLFSTVMAIHPGLTEIKQTLSPLVNGKWVSEDTELKDGDRVALVPPVGGG
jgi:molybdopterin converting factor small subunit